MTDDPTAEDSDRMPQGVAMILSDSLYVCPATGKRSLLGMFNVVGALALPARTGPFTVYCAVTDCSGPTLFRFCVVDVNEEREPVFVIPEIRVEVPDPLAIAELQFFLPPLEFPEAGEYRLQLLFQGVSVMERRLVVMLRQPPPQHPEESNDER